MAEKRKVYKLDGEDPIRYKHVPEPKGEGKTAKTASKGAAKKKKK